MKRLFCIMFAMCTMLSGCGSEVEESNKISVFVDSSLIEAMNAVVEEYNKENVVDIEIVGGSTSSLLNKIERGADCDIYIPSAKDPINSLIEDDYLKEENVTPILENTMVLIKKNSSNSTVKSFDTVSEAKSIALVKESEPAGLFAREIFINLNVFKQVLAMKTSEYESSQEVVDAIINGKNEVGVCFETDALAKADKIQVIALAPSESINSDILYSVAVLNAADGFEPEDKVKNFAEYLDTPEAADIFDDFDFGIYIS